MKQFRIEGKLCIVASTVLLLLPGVLALPSSLRSKLEAAPSSENAGTEEDFGMKQNYADISGTDKDLLKFLSHKNSGEYPGQYDDADDIDWKNKMKSMNEPSHHEPYASDTKDRNWSDVHQDKRAEDPAQDGSRYLSDYDEYVYSLRAIPYLFKKKSSHGEVVDQPQKKNDGMSQLFKRMLQGEAAGSDDDFKRNTGDTMEAMSRDIPSLFRRFEGERSNVPFLFRRDRPYIVRQILKPQLAEKSIPFLFRKTLREPTYSHDRKARIDSLFRRQDLDHPEYVPAKRDSNASLTRKNQVISGLF